MATRTVGSGYTYSTIQAAVNAAATEDDIEVHHGTYVENVTVPNGKRLDFLGVTDGVSVPIIQAASWDNYTGTVRFNNNGCTINNFKITSGWAGLYIVGVTGCTVTYCEVYNCIHCGIYLYGANSNIISYNNCHNNCSGSTEGETRNAIQLDHSSNCEVHHNTCRQNGGTIPKPDGHSYYLSDGVSNIYTSNDNEIYNNDISLSHFGIWVLQSSGVSVHDNILGHDEADSCYYNLMIEDSDNILAEDNTCTHGGRNVYVRDYTYSPYGQSTYVTVKNNTCTSGIYGIVVENCIYCTIEGNDVSSCTYNGFIFQRGQSGVGGTTNCTVTRNYIHGNGSAAMIDGYSSGNRCFRNSFADGMSTSTGNLWVSAEAQTYVYNSTTYNHIMGNKWSGYGGSDTDSDGIGNTSVPYIYGNVSDAYPLVAALTSYTDEGEEPEPPPTTGYTYYKDHAIIGSTSEPLTDYHIRFKIYNSEGEDSGMVMYTGGHCQNFPADIKFTDTNNNDLDFYHEFTDTYAYFWVKVPTIPQNGEVTIRVCYGAGDVTQSESDGAATFPFFDDFSTALDTTNKWTLYQCTPTVSGGEVAITTTAGSYSGIGGFYSKTLFGPNGVGLRMRVKSASNADSVVLGIHADNDYVMIQFAPDGGTKGFGGTVAGSEYTTGFTQSGHTTYYRYQVEKLGSSLLAFYHSDTDQKTITNATYIPTSSGYVYFLNQDDGTTTMDYCFIYKVSQYAPTHSIWGEETAMGGGGGGGEEEEIPTEGGGDGDPGTPPAGSDVRIRVSGRVVNVLKGSVRIDKNIQHTNTASFTIVDLTGSTQFRPRDKVEIWNDSTKEFHGFINKMTEKPIPPVTASLNRKYIDVECIGTQYLFQKLATDYWSLMPQKTIEAEVANLIRIYGEGTDVKYTATSLPLDDQTALDDRPVWRNVALDKVFDELAARKDYYWYIDDDLTFYFLHRSKEISAPWNLTATDILASGFNVSREEPYYRNYQIVNNPFTKWGTITQNQSYDCNGSNRNYYQTDVIKTPPGADTGVVSITVNGVVVPTGDIGKDGYDTGKKWYYQEGGRLVRHDESQTALAAGSTLQIVTYKDSGFVASSYDWGEAVLQGKRDGSPLGRVYNVYDADGELGTQAAGDALAQRMLDTNMMSSFRLKFRTLRSGLKPGQTLSVSIPQYGIGNVWDFYKTHTITATDGPLTNYQILVTVYRGSGTDSGSSVYLNERCRNWPYDIKFMDSGRTADYDFYMEYADNDMAYFWIEVPTIAASGTTTFCIVYGHGTMYESASNGPDTFLFFDNFDSGVLDDSKWSQVSGGWCAVTGYTLLYGYALNGGAETKSTFGPYNVGVHLITRQTTENTVALALRVGFGDTPTSSKASLIDITTANGVRTYAHNGTSSGYSSAYSGSPDLYTETRLDVEFLSGQTRGRITGGSWYTVNYAPTTAMKVQLISTTATAMGYATEIYVYKTTPNAPTHTSWGTETAYGQPPLGESAYTKMLVESVSISADPTYYVYDVTASYGPISKEWSALFIK